VRDVHVERVSTSLNDAVGIGQTLSVTWRGWRDDTGEMLEVVTTFAITDPSVFLVQSDWDVMYHDASVALGTLAGGTVPGANPVALP
jgi:hypothetical protein